MTDPEVLAVRARLVAGLVDSGLEPRTFDVHEHALLIAYVAELRGFVAMLPGAQGAWLLDEVDELATLLGIRDTLARQTGRVLEDHPPA